MATNFDYAMLNLSSIGIDINQDFHSIPMSLQNELSDLAKYCGYRLPKNANGSTARYFWAALQRKHKAGKK